MRLVSKAHGYESRLLTSSKRTPNARPAIWSRVHGGVSVKAACSVKSLLRRCVTATNTRSHCRAVNQQIESAATADLLEYRTPAVRLQQPARDLRNQTQPELAIPRLTDRSIPDGRMLSPLHSRAAELSAT